MALLILTIQLMFITVKVERKAPVALEESMVVIFQQMERLELVETDSIIATVMAVQVAAVDISAVVELAQVWDLAVAQATSAA